MKITAQVKLKLGQIIQALESLGYSIPKFAKKHGISTNTLYKVINLKKRPTKQLASRIELAFAVHGVNIDILSEWPKEFIGVTSNKFSITKEVEILQLTSQHTDMLLEDSNPFEILSRKDYVEAALNAVEDPKAKKVLVDILGGKRESQIGRELGIGGERVRLLKEKGLRQIRAREGRSALKVF